MVSLVIENGRFMSVTVRHATLSYVLVVRMLGGQPTA